MNPNWYLDTVVVTQPHLERTLQLDCRSWLDKQKTDTEKVLDAKLGDNPGKGVDIFNGEYPPGVFFAGRPNF